MTVGGREPTRVRKLPRETHTDRRINSVHCTNVIFLNICSVRVLTMRKSSALGEAGPELHYRFFCNL